MKNKSNQAACLAILGTGSDVGKSIITTAICRCFARKGISISPFKAQNMSNNSGVTPEGLEMGRAQIVQAEASNIAPHVDMNPILLKPTSDVGSQIVLFGKALENSTASEYHKRKDQFYEKACQALERLRNNHDLIAIEGAGSCAEVNLMPQDIVNFRMAEYAHAPVILVGDIHRGGIFAQIVGTLSCIPQDLQDRVAGFIINRFRGDLSLFKDGIDWIEKKTGKCVFGVVPWYDHFSIESEDSVVIENPVKVSPERLSNPSIAVIRIPHISNFTDFDPLSNLNGLTVHFLETVQDLTGFNAVILPGSKNTRFDLEWLNTTGWAKKVIGYSKGGGHVLGICGGYQMMGDTVHDPDGIEGQPGKTQGLSLLPVKTTLKEPKTTTRTRFMWDGVEGMGYEIHMGQTQVDKADAPFLIIEQNQNERHQPDGCIDPMTGNIGTYIHGLFDHPRITQKWLHHIGLKHIEISEIHGPSARDHSYDLLAEHFLKHIDIKKIESVIEFVKT